MDNRKAVRLIPNGANDPLPPIPTQLEITEADIEKAIRAWDNAFPEYEGLLDAEAVNENPEAQ